MLTTSVVFLEAQNLASSTPEGRAGPYPQFVIAAHHDECTRRADNPKDTSRSPGTARRLGIRFQKTVYKNQRGEENIGVNAVRKVKGWEQIVQEIGSEVHRKGKGSLYYHEC